ncbi:hypothetical protein C4D60_Mb03t05430 [Musa balbisiana]|uniref:Uncharacterized protein n=1 Tax=Musa balbisiana TaxID=52838 RepID=A0A4S8J7Q2_MUSBA|nr:hypothetical protein C4D60_Mb03t05430 [Musa balbisiana]
MLTLAAVACTYAAKHLFPDQSPFLLSLPLLLFFLSFVFSFPIFGNWLQVGNDHNHRNLVDTAKKYGNVFLLRLGSYHNNVISGIFLHCRNISGPFFLIAPTPKSMSQLVASSLSCIG